MKEVFFPLLVDKDAYDFRFLMRKPAIPPIHLRLR